MNLAFDRSLPPSTTLAPEWEHAGHTHFNLWIQSKDLNELTLERALNCYDAALKIRKKHLNVAPFCTTLDVANVHSHIAKVHAAFTSNRATHRGAAANNYFAAFQIRRQVLGNEHTIVTQSWMLFKNA